MEILKRKFLWRNKKKSINFFLFFFFLPNGDFDYTNSKGLRLVRDKIRIVENITKQKIEFTLENVYDADRQCLGVLATFILPILNSNNYEVDEQISPIDEE